MPTTTCISYKTTTSEQGRSQWRPRRQTKLSPWTMVVAVVDDAVVGGTNACAQVRTYRPKKSACR